MKKLEYNDFIEGINNPYKIKQIDFYVDGYSHYRNCSIGRYINKTTFKGKTFATNYRITCILTKDHSEDVSFAFTFKENRKLFNFGKKGRFTLKDVWDKIVITNIVFFEQNDVLKTIIEKVPSFDCRLFLNKNLNYLSLFQWCTIVMEADCSKNEKIQFLNDLLPLCKTSYESKLIEMAISDLKKYGYISKRIDNYFERHDPRQLKSNVAFNEYIDFPIVYKKGDVVCYDDDGTTKLLVIGMRPSIYDADKHEYGDSTYLAYEIATFNDLFNIHCHPHATKLKTYGFNQLNKNEKNIYKKIMDIISEDDYLNKV